MYEPYAVTVYDAHNIFAKILRKEIHTKIILETDHSLAFHDAFPKAPIHALVIPKGNYTDLHDFCKKASKPEVIDFWQTVHRTIEALNMEQDGYRMISNSGINGGQEIPHFHVHLCGGIKLSPMTVKQ